MHHLKKFLIGLVFLSSVYGCQATRSDLDHQKNFGEIAGGLLALSATDITANLDVYDTSGKSIARQELTIRDNQVLGQAILLPSDANYTFVISFLTTDAQGSVALAYARVNKTINPSQNQVRYVEEDILYENPNGIENSLSANLSDGNFSIPNLDLDGDGVSNLNEIIDGSDARDAQSKNIPPVITFDNLDADGDGIFDTIVMGDEPITITGTVTDVAGVDKLFFEFLNQNSFLQEIALIELNAEEETFSIIFQSNQLRVGSYDFPLIARDTLGNRSLASDNTLSLQIDETPDDNAGPLIGINGLLEDDTISGIVDLQIVIYDLSPISSYRVLDPRGQEVTGLTNQDVSGQTVSLTYQLDTNTLETGSHSLQIDATDSLGQQTTRVIRFNVDNAEDNAGPIITIREGLGEPGETLDAAVNIIVEAEDRNGVTSLVMVQPAGIDDQNSSPSILTALINPLDFRQSPYTFVFEAVDGLGNTSRFQVERPVENKGPIVEVSLRAPTGVTSGCADSSVGTAFSCRSEQSLRYRGQTDVIVTASRQDDLPGQQVELSRVSFSDSSAFTDLGSGFSTQEKYFLDTPESTGDDCCLYSVTATAEDDRSKVTTKTFSIVYDNIRPVVSGFGGNYQIPVVSIGKVAVDFELDASSSYDLPRFDAPAEANGQIVSYSWCQLNENDGSEFEVLDPSVDLTRFNSFRWGATCLDGSDSIYRGSLSAEKNTAVVRLIIEDEVGLTTTQYFMIYRDADQDGIRFDDDNCPSVPNPEQTDTDRDELGDLCDPDADNDGFANDDDNCFSEANVNQADFDGDGYGDECDDDIDGDRLLNTSSEEYDNDGDGVDDSDEGGDTAPCANDPYRSPNHPEILGDGIDNNCNGEIDQVTDIDAGLYHTCAIVEGTNLYCWGLNHLGQTQIPAEVKNAERIHEVSTGHNHTCVRADFGTEATSNQVVCWGDINSTEILAGGSYADSLFGAITSGNRFSCGIAEGGGSFSCWGDVPDGADSLSGSVTNIQAGESHICGLTTSSGEASCVGLPDAAPSGGLSFLASGSGFSCGVTELNTVACWWGGATGALDASLSEFETGAGLRMVDAKDQNLCFLTDSAVACFPGPIAGIEAPSGVYFVKIAVGKHHACGITGAGQVHCWGDITDGKAIVPKPDIIEVETNEAQTCVLEKPSGSFNQVWCWPHSNPDASLDDLLTVTDHSPIEFDAGFNPRKIAVGLDIVCALDSDGRLACDGELLNGSSPRIPVDLTSFIGSSAPRFHEIVLGDSFLCGLEIGDAGSSAGRVHCLGSLSGFILGTEDFEQIEADGDQLCGLTTDGVILCKLRTETPLRRLATNNFSKIATGGDAYCGVFFSGYTTGEGNYRCLSPSAPAPATTDFFIDIDTHENYLCGQNSNRTLSCFGNSSIELDSPILNPDPYSVMDFDLAEDHACALEIVSIRDGSDDFGSVTCWGRVVR